MTAILKSVTIVQIRTDMCKYVSDKALFLPQGNGIPCWDAAIAHLVELKWLKCENSMNESDDRKFDLEWTCPFENSAPSHWSREQLWWGALGWLWYQKMAKVDVPKSYWIPMSSPGNLLKKHANITMLLRFRVWQRDTKKEEVLCKWRLPFSGHYVSLCHLWCRAWRASKPLSFNFV